MSVFINKNIINKLWSHFTKKIKKTCQVFVRLSWSYMCHFYGDYFLLDIITWVTCIMSEGPQCRTPHHRIQIVLVTLSWSSWWSWVSATSSWITPWDVPMTPPTGDSCLASRYTEWVSQLMTDLIRLIKLL